jgi:hypothetical protein
MSACLWDCSFDERPFDGHVFPFADFSLHTLHCFQMTESTEQPGGLLIPATSAASLPLEPRVIAIRYPPNISR